MNNCIGCEKTTKNPKYCSHSCRARVTNKNTRRHGQQPTNCLVCGVKNTSYSSKTCSHSCAKINLFNERFEKWKQTGVATKSTITRYLKNLGYECFSCKISEWNGKPISLEIEHIDGNYENNAMSNLCYLCPNCHSQTSTYKGRNKGNGRTIRKRKQNNGT